MFKISHPKLSGFSSPQKVIDIFKNYRVEFLDSYINSIKQKYSFEMIDIIVEQANNLCNYFLDNFVKNKAEFIGHKLDYNYLQNLFNLIRDIIEHTQYKFETTYHSIFYKKFYFINNEGYTNYFPNSTKVKLDNLEYYEIKLPVNALVLKDRIEKLIRGLKSKFFFDFKLFTNRSFYYITILDYLGNDVFSFAGFIPDFHLIKTTFEFLSSDLFNYIYFVYRPEADNKDILDIVFSKMLFSHYILNIVLGYDKYLNSYDILGHIESYNKRFSEKIVITEELKSKYSILLDL